MPFTCFRESDNLFAFIHDDNAKDVDGIGFFDLADILAHTKREGERSEILPLRLMNRFEFLHGGLVSRRKHPVTVITS